MNFFVVGINHKECPVEVREKIHFTSKLLDAAFHEVKRHPEFLEFMILSTCNRVEFYGFAAQPVIPEQPLLGMIEKLQGVDRHVFLPYLYRCQGKEAVRHLFRVASGLDSLVVGENEILGQLREAFRTANQGGSVHAFLYRLAEKALKAGKDVRSKTKIGEGAVSIPSVAVELAEKIFGRLASEKVMVIGTGEMSGLTLRSLRQAGAEALYIVSRNEERGRKLAVEFDAQWVPLSDWLRYLAGVDIIIASTAAPHPIVRYSEIVEGMKLRRNRPLFLIDIAVPRDIEPEVNAIEDVYLYNIDDLKSVARANLKLRSREIQAAEEIVDQAVQHFQGWIEQLEARPTLERFENFLNEVLEKELSVLAKAGTLNEEKKNQMKDRLRSKLLHPPLEKIKEASQNGGSARYLEALQSLFGLEKSKE